MANELRVVHELEVAAPRKERRNRYARHAHPSVAAALENAEADTSGTHLDDEIDLLRELLVALTAHADAEKLADPEYSARIINTAKAIAALADTKNRIETSEQFVATPAALKKFAYNHREAVRLAIEEGVGASPTPEQAALGARIWTIFNRNMERLKVDIRAKSQPTLAAPQDEE